MHQFDTVYDVAVFGSGFCGFGAAVSLAEMGSKVLLVDRRPVLGWEGTWAYRLDFADVQPGVPKSLAERLQAAGGLKNGRADAAIMEMVLDRMAAEAGLDLLYYAQAVSLLRADDTCTGVVVAGKSGSHTVMARAFVDATENGVLWTRHGGRIASSHAQQAVHVLVLNGVKTLQSPQALGTVEGVDNVVLNPSVWDGEVAVEFGLAAPDVRMARRALPDLLKGLREGSLGLEHGVVTHVATEPFPLRAASAEAAGVTHPKLKNLFAAGPWLGGRVDTLSARLQCGERAGREISKLVGDIPTPGARAGAEPAIVAPPVHDWDVVVCGGGTAGPFAAIASARQGAKTALIESSSILGGMGTGGGIHCYYHGVPGGIQDEADARQKEIEPLFGPAGGFHPQAKSVVLQQMADEAGVELVFYTTTTGVATSDVPTALPAAAGQRAARRVTAVITAGPEGSALHRTKVVVDSTGDGDVAFMAGADYTFGRETDNLPHAYSLAAGRLDPKGKLLLTNFDAGYCDPTDLTDLTRARRLALSHYWRDRFDASNRLVYVAPLLGLRNSRQIVGDYRLTLSDEISGRQFPDVIAYAYSHFDNHGYDFENESDEAMLWVWTLGNWSRKFGCEIPYRCLLPLGIEGILVACRAISLTHDAHNQLRMQRDMQRLGEAAGTAAGLAVKHDTTPRALDVSILQEALVNTGALGPRRPAELPAPEAKQVHDSSWVPAQPPAMPLQECVEHLGSDDRAEAAWQLVRAGRDAAPLLKEALKSADPTTRVWAATALAMLRQPEAGPELIACVQHRLDEQATQRKQGPLWHSAVVLLGRLGDKAAVPALTAVLDDRSAGLDVLVGAVRALGRIGDTSAAPALEAMLARKDLPAVREFQVSTAGMENVRQDALWQIELAAAEALALLGRSRPDLVAKHKADERAYVRRYAAKVEGLSA